MKHVMVDIETLADTNNADDCYLQIKYCSQTYNKLKIL